jgi:tetratricopeptide (TPR) repeat protein
MNKQDTRELPPGLPVTDSEREQNLIQALAQCPQGQKRAEVLWKLSRFYHYQAYRSDLAGSLVDLMTKERESDDRTAAFHLAEGQKAQTQQKWEIALEHYAQGLSRLPKEARTLYLLYNNGAHCRNMLGLYAEAEKYCRLAIETDSKRHEAYINLGISLEGQRDMTGAAWCFVEALKANPFNLQAAERLRQLLIDYPTLPVQSPWIAVELDLLERG